MTRCVTELTDIDLFGRILGRGQAGDHGSGGEAAPGRAQLRIDVFVGALLGTVHPPSNQ